MSEHVVVIGNDGILQGMWSDDLIPIYEGGEVQRASHVEPCMGKECRGLTYSEKILCPHWHVWERDGQELMMPIGFRTREHALNAERRIIEDRLMRG